ncbi:NAD(P)H-quinone oxidoreductase subunit 4L [Desulfurispira natronophila]|uniref:NADH-quinone oxidoreductase subunit K n=1 Tax=Desulfurispira natronophila TaxID=682562 RepID=A0A7W8DHD6_9BACT|nr:NADH-quinone oxidoreductase subunit NuoK [Desulfurispira natronophila]MBB5022456.1 NAD(P)H-quinone oxidoreductase subunit 4L [Desulfurispira natronophila]
MLSITLNHFLYLASALFCLGIFGIIVSRNAIKVLLSIEVMLAGVTVAFVAISRYVTPDTIEGQIITVFILTVAAAEAAIGLAILLAVYRNYQTVDMSRFNLLKW